MYLSGYKYQLVRDQILDKAFRASRNLITFFEFDDMTNRYLYHDRHIRMIPYFLNKLQLACWRSYIHVSNIWYFLKIFRIPIWLHFSCMSALIYCMLISIYVACWHIYVACWHNYIACWYNLEKNNLHTGGRKRSRKNHSNMIYIAHNTFYFNFYRPWHKQKILEWE
jgi:hypothetical protein